MRWPEFWHYATTTRYTRRLESEIQQLRADNERLRGDNDGLLMALYPAIRSIRTEHEVAHETSPTNVKSFKWRKP